MTSIIRILLFVSAMPFLFSIDASAQEFDCTALVEGENAPRLAAFAEAIRVQAQAADPNARVSVGNETKTVRLHSNAEGAASAQRVIDAARAATSPSARLLGANFYQQTTATRDGTGRLFFNREIAQVMGHLGASWLERPTREKEERTALLIDLLGIESDTDVADIGAGTGYFTFPIAKRAHDGTTYAVDIQPEMLEFIEARKRHEKVSNVTGVLGRIDNAQLAPNSIDLAFAVDAFHEFSHPWEMLQSIRKALRPGGRLVLVEFRLEDPEVPIKRLHKMTEKQARREVEAAGFDWIKTDASLPRQHVLVFQRPELKSASPLPITEDDRP